jgi:glucose-6-phosphate 1-dehydrogenase
MNYWIVVHISIITVLLAVYLSKPATETKLQTNDIKPMASDLQKENERLRKEIEDLKSDLQVKRVASGENNSPRSTDLTTELNGVVSIAVIGASGDLAKKKTFPSLFTLYSLGLLPKETTIFGYARTKMEHEEFHKHATQNFKGDESKKKAFSSNLFYVAGSYSSAQDFALLDAQMTKHEAGRAATRVFYFAIPPSIFVDVAKAVKASAMSQTGETRLIIEKPFGRDLESSNVLSTELSALFKEEQIYRIDHYLGKEMVQNLMLLRFANLAFEPLWNRNFIANVLITFKEDIGTEGRGGYFDSFGIIRDVMQNHLMQIFTLVAMEAPVTLNAEDVRDEKVKVLRATTPISTEDVVIGQYTGNVKNKGYKDDAGVPKESVTPTFATAVLHINNSRWKGVPFILKCGKALNERKAEIRIQFHENAASLFPDAPRNELVMRVQPDEAIYFKLNSKVPGLGNNHVQTELDLTYKQRFDARLPDAYERLIYDVLRGDHNLFVRDDELEAAWKIYTPLLHHLEGNKVKPVEYEFGSRGPQESDVLASKYGFVRSADYKWEPKNVCKL